MTFYFEPFDYHSDAHYEAMLRLDAAMYPLYPDSVEAAKHRDSARLAKYHRYRVGLKDGKTDEFVGFGVAAHAIDTYHPNKFVLDLIVDPALPTENAVRQKLYDHLVDYLAPFNPIQLESTCNSAQTHVIRFFEARGFTLKVREFSSKLELADFDPAPFQRYLERAAANGIELINLDEIQARYPDKWMRMVYDVATEVDLDVPWHEPIQAEPYDQWVKRFLQSPDLLTQCHLIAFDGDNPVGITMMFKTDTTDKALFTGLTGVKRSHRRQGLAFALKVQSLTAAIATMRADDGTLPYVMAENEENNPMYAINKRLGFVRQPDWLFWVKRSQNSETLAKATFRDFDFSDRDYDIAVNLRQAVWPNNPIDIVNVRYWDSIRPKSHYYKRIICEVDGQAVGIGGFVEAHWLDVPDYFELRWSTHPDHRRKGYASAFYAYALATMTADGKTPKIIESGTREDVKEAIAFLEKRGFVLKERYPRSALSMSQLDLTHFAHYKQRAVDNGIVIKPLSDVIPTDPDWQRKVYDLEWVFEQDEPGHLPPKQQPFEEYVKNTLGNADFKPEMWFMALDGDRYAGMSCLWPDKARPNKLSTGWTGVDRPYRRQGLAMALKVTALAYAQQLPHIEVIETDNHEDNWMYQINLRLGFRPIPAWLNYTKIR